MNMETILGRNIDLFFFEPFLPRFSITVTGHGLSRLVLSNLGRCSAFFLVSLQCSYRFFVFHRISFRRLLFIFNICVLLRKHPCRNHDLAFAAEVHIQPFLLDSLHLQSPKDAINSKAELSNKGVPVVGANVKDNDGKLLAGVWRELEVSLEIPLWVKSV